LEPVTSQFPSIYPCCDVSESPFPDPESFIERLSYTAQNVDTGSSFRESQEYFASALVFQPMPLSFNSPEPLDEAFFFPSMGAADTFR
jgi:hypothetical protein